MGVSESSEEGSLRAPYPQLYDVVGLTDIGHSEQLWLRVTYVLWSNTSSQLGLDRGFFIGKGTALLQNLRGLHCDSLMGLSWTPTASLPTTDTPSIYGLLGQKASAPALGPFLALAPSGSLPCHLVDRVEQYSHVRNMPPRETY